MKEDKVLSCVGLVVLATVVIVVSALLNGWVLSIMWTWFIVPVFGLPKIALVPAIGVGMVVSFLTHRPTQDPPNEDMAQKWVRAITEVFSYPLMTLSFGWIFHLVM